MASLPNQGKGTHANYAPYEADGIIQKLTCNSIKIQLR